MSADAVPEPALLGDGADGRFQLARAAIGERELLLVRAGGRLLDLAAVLGERDPAPRSLQDVVEDPERWTERIAAALDQRGASAADLAGEELRWLPAVGHPRKLVCVGANYRDHIAEMGFSPTRARFPYCFMVPPSTGIVGSGATVAIPALAEKIDWEAELAVVVGRPMRGLTPDDAMAHVAGYVVLNDLSARDWSGPHAPAVGIDWVMTKAFDGFKPVGPYLTPAAFVDDPDDLPVRAWVNGELEQDGNTRDMLFGIGEILAHLSSIMTLEPGDLVATGTPAGTGHGHKPPKYLRAGDRVTVEVAGLGRLETTLG